MVHTNENDKKAGITILISDKISLQNKFHNERQKTLCNDKGINIRKGYYTC